MTVPHDPGRAMSVVPSRRSPCATRCLTSTAGSSRRPVSIAAPTWPAGTGQIYVAVRFQGYGGRSGRIDLASPTGVVEGGTFFIPADDATAAPLFCFTPSSCELERVPMLRGTYTAKVFVDGVLAGSGQFRIE